MTASDLSRPLVEASVAAYWVDYFACAPELLSSSGTHVMPHAGLADYSGVYLFRRGASCIVSAPAPLVSTLSTHLGNRDAASSFDTSRLQSLFGENVERIVGPAWQGYIWPTAFMPAPTDGVRQLTADDGPALQGLAAACGELAWEHSGIGGADQMVFGRFAGDMLVAAGMGEPRANILLHIGIVTHPDYRGRGHGQAVVSALTAYGLASGRVPWYQTLAANTPSVAIARALGFSQYAETIAVRLARIPE